MAFKSLPSSDHTFCVCSFVLCGNMSAMQNRLSQDSRFIALKPNKANERTKGMLEPLSGSGCLTPELSSYQCQRSLGRLDKGELYPERTTTP